MYTGQKRPEYFPIIGNMQVSKQDGLAPKEIFDVKVSMRGNVNMEDVRFQYFFSTTRDVIGLEEFPNKDFPAKVKAKEVDGSASIYAPLVARSRIRREQSL